MHLYPSDKTNSLKSGHYICCQKLLKNPNLVKNGDSHFESDSGDDWSVKEEIQNHHILLESSLCKFRLAHVVLRSLNFIDYL